jgi:hypothetical protein
MKFLVIPTNLTFQLSIAKHTRNIFLHSRCKILVDLYNSRDSPFYSSIGASMMPYSRDGIWCKLLREVLRLIG